ncbi:hypothetical protein CVT24_012764 [Panaeolus cyanescens]|uniref:Uncharacterized protein n=1 Tax=Panaeolus cyanescens TaxID=181874 RepID=A0A409YJF1_9AGAR|nr:hypothetical protein CVT24_012764 [Panaeolus cyanescens]
MVSSLRDLRLALSLLSAIKLTNLNTTELALHIAVFGELHAGLGSVPDIDTVKSKVLSSILSVIQAMPIEQEIPAISIVISQAYTTVLLNRESEHDSLWPKEEPPEDLLLWRFIGKPHVILSNGEPWIRQSHVVKSALTTNLPIHEFVSLAKVLLKKMGDGGLIRWADYALRSRCLTALLLGTTSAPLKTTTAPS